MRAKELTPFSPLQLHGTTENQMLICWYNFKKMRDQCRLVEKIFFLIFKS